jgi:GGDEF domain-containing protein
MEATCFTEPIGAEGTSLGARLDGDPAEAADVIDTLRERPADLSGALARFGRCLGAEGWPLDELSGWIDELAAMAGDGGAGLSDFDAGVALGQGWAEGFVHGAHAEACVDALTGLATAGVLRVRLSQVFDKCRALDLDPARSYAIVVVDAGGIVGQPLTRDAVLIALADRVRDVFATGETVCRAGDRILVLTPLEPELPARVEGFTPHLGAGVMAWTEALPDDGGQLDGFLLDLVG